MPDKSLSVYNQELVTLSSQVEEPYYLSNPQISAKSISPICGSEVTIEICLKDDKIEAFGYQLEACALTKAAVAIIKNIVIGKTRNDIYQAGEKLKLMLSDNDIAPSGDWEALKIFIPVVEYKSRHNSILLPFHAIEKAFKDLEAKEKK